MAEEPEDPRRLYAQFEFVQRELGRVENRLEAIQDALVEANQAASTLRGLSESAGREALVPIGAGVHVRATLATDAVVRPIGAGYATDGSIEDAQAQLQARAEALQRSFHDASAEAERLATTAAAINERLSTLSNADMV